MTASMRSARRPFHQLDVLGVGRAHLPGTGRVVEDLLRQQPDQPSDSLVLAVLVTAVQRQVDRHHALAEHALADGHGLVEVGAWLVQLGHHHGARQADGRALLPHERGGAVQPVGGGDHEQGRVGRPQARPELAHVVRVPGRVDQVDGRVADRERDDGRPDRDAAPPLERERVGLRRATVDAADRVDHAGRVEQPLRESCLTGVYMRQDPEVQGSASHASVPPSRS
jgi:hypothetical protein